MDVRLSRPVRFELCYKGGCLVMLDEGHVSWAKGLKNFITNSSVLKLLILPHYFLGEYIMLLALTKSIHWLCLILSTLSGLAFYLWSYFTTFLG